MKIGFTGTREGITNAQSDALIALLFLLGPNLVAHGDCIGSDAEFHAICRRHMLPAAIEIFPPLDNRFRSGCFNPGNVLHPAGEYLDRNRAIVDFGQDGLIACPSGPEERRSGTWSTVRYARKQGKRIFIVWPDGTITEESAK